MEDTKQATIIARTLAALVAALGLYFAYTMAAAIPKILRTSSDTFDIFFLFVFPLPFLALSIYFVYSGYRLWFKISPESTRRISFVISIIIFSLLIWACYRSPLKSDKFDGLLTPLCMIPAGIFYLLFNRLLTKLLNLPTNTDWVQREKSAKRFFGWFVFFFLSSACQLLTIYLSPEKYSSDTFPDLVVLPLFVVGTIVLAFVIYKLGVKIALRNKPKDEDKSINSVASAINT